MPKHAVVTVTDDNATCIGIVDPLEANVIVLWNYETYTRHAATALMARLGYVPQREGWIKTLGPNGEILNCTRRFTPKTQWRAI